MSRPLKVPGHLRELARLARSRGWEISPSGSGHLRWRSPRGTVVMTGSTPQRYGHTSHNERRELAKAGLRRPSVVRPKRKPAAA